MVTVIATNEDFSSSSGHNSSTTTNNVSNEFERKYFSIKDFQEVDFHLWPSFKPFPDDLLTLIESNETKKEIHGEFFVQIDEIRSIEQSNSLILTLNDGIRSIQAVSEDDIPHLNGNVKSGCKLLITGVISLENSFLRLTNENTKFQFGSRTYPRPRSAYRGRGGGSSRPSYEGRRGGGGGNGGVYHRHDENSSETNFFKRPPAKNTLMDFMTTLNISRDSKSTNDDEKRRTIEISTNNSNEPVISDSNDLTEQIESEDDPTQSIYRERRNPLPPRLQRAQEERSRRNTIRQYDETILIPNEEINGDFHLGTSQHHSLMSSSSSTYFRTSDPREYFSPNPSILQPFPTHPTMISPLNNSGATYVTYIPTNSAHLTYNMLNGTAYPTYSNENLTFCYGNPYAPVTYLPATPMNNNGYADERKSFVESTDENESQTDETTTQTFSSSNDENSSTKKFLSEQKHYESHSVNPRPRWKVNDLCLARWSEDRQFYVANILQIQPPFVTVVFLDYQNCEQVHFSDLRLLPREQQNYSSLMNPVSNVSTSDLNPLAASAFYPIRNDFYSSNIDQCLTMPEVPPFPFNSAGTIHLYPTTIPILSRSNRSTSNSHRRYENGETTTINSNETSINDSTTTTSNDEITTLIEKKNSNESV